MIEAAKTFEEYIKKENITGFAIREVGDDRNTTVFESEIEAGERRLDPRRQRHRDLRQIRHRHGNDPHPSLPSLRRPPMRGDCWMKLRLHPAVPFWCPFRR